LRAINPLQPQLVQCDAVNNSALFRDVLNLFETTFTDECEFSRDELEDSILEGKHYALALPNEDGRIKGFAVIGNLSGFNGTYCLLDYFAVAPAFRGNGFGGKFFKMVVNYMSEMTSRKVMLLECEERLITWYEKLGARRTLVPPSLCGDKLFYLLGVSCSGDPTDSDGNEVHRARAALNEVRNVLHGMSNYELNNHYEHGDELISCLLWS